MRVKKQTMYMRDYLTIPENRVKHNYMSKRWFITKYHNSVRFRNKRKKYVTNHIKTNLAYLMYYDFLGMLHYERNRLAYSLYYQLKELCVK